MKTLLIVAGLAAVAVATDIHQLNAECGHPAIAPDTLESRIIGGKEAVVGSWPWHVGLYQKPWSDIPSLNHGSHYCAGTLIDNQTVITAAHCLGIPPSRMRVHLGAHLRSQKDNTERYVEAAYFCSYPSWRQGNVFDIAIIRLSEVVQFTDYISPVCLPAKKSEIEDNETPYVTGWGYTSAGWNRQPAEVLKQAAQRAITSAECVQMRPIANPDSIVCTAHDHGSSCHGDSGGPLVVQRGKEWQLVGVVSGGPPVCGLKDWPMYYTKVAYPDYFDWIERYYASPDPRADPNICKEAGR